jgi:pyruvate dehydrogenase E2 component (dihydrolipoamide acetyltransferase)
MMTIDILVPPLSQTMDSVTLIEWEKNIGDAVTKGEVLFRIETDKATLEVECPATGMLGEILVEPGSEVKIRSKVGTIVADGEDIPVGRTSMPEMQQTDRAERGEKTAPAQVGLTGPEGEPLPQERQNRIFASPRARRLAEMEGVPLDGVRPSGPKGTIVEQDVKTYLEEIESKPKVTPVARRMAEKEGLDLDALVQAKPGERITRSVVEAAIAQQAAVEIDATLTASTLQTDEPLPVDEVVHASRQSRPVELTTIRRTIADRMQQSHQTSAPVTLTREVDATELVELRERILKELDEEQERPSYTDFLASIVARGLKRHPYMNGTFEDETLELFENINLALAVDTDRGLIVPVMSAVEGRGLLELARLRTDLMKRTFDGTVTLDELQSGTFTLTNLGTLGVDAFTPIINPPQIAILGVGRIRSTPAVYEGQVTIRQMMYLSLTFDHRVVDGGPAARFLAEIAQLVEKPHLIWL